MKFLLLTTLVLAFGICSPIPVLERWQAGFRAEVRAAVHDYLPATPQSAARRALLREICALPDSAYDLD